MMFYVYRPQRGSLNESIREMKICRTIDDMKKLIIEDFSKFGVVLTPDEVTIGDDVINDDRIGWTATRYVCVAHMGKERSNVPQCVGMCCDSEHIPVEVKLALEEYLNGDNWKPSFSIRSIGGINPKFLYAGLTFTDTKKPYFCGQYTPRLNQNKGD